MLTSGVPLQDVQAMQILTGAAMALWLAIGYVPRLRAHTGRIRLGILGVFVAAGVGMFVHAILS